MARQRNSNPPIVRLNLIQPFLEELDRQRIDSKALMARDRISRQSILDPEVFVPAIVVYRFVENASNAANDPYLGAKIGENLDLAAWPPLLDAVTRSATLIEFFTRFIRAAKEEASSAYHVLEIGQEQSSLKETRTHSPYISPSQNDAFTAAFTLSLLIRGAATAWDPDRVRVKVCDPKALPEDYLGVRVVTGDRLGMSVEFPSDWLLLPLDLSRFINKDLTVRINPDRPRDFIAALRSLLVLHLDQPELNVDSVAELFGISRQSLQRLARSNGTTLLKEITALKKDRACHDLAKTKKPVSEIAASVGFRSVVSFSRAFKAWTDLSPSEYRKLSR